MTSSHRSTRLLIALAAGALALPACAPNVETQPPRTATSAPAGTAPPVASTAPPAPEDPAMAARRDEILSRYFAAQGGLDKLRAIQSIRSTGKARLGGNGSEVEAAFASTNRRPGLARSEITFQGLTAVDAYDGKDAWATSPFGGRRDPFRKSADETKQAADDADIDGPLVDWRQKGHRVEYLGTEDIDGTLAHKLRVTLKDGNFQYYFLDPDAMLTIRIESHTFVRGVESIGETDLGDYEQVGGVWMAFAIDSGEKGSPKTFHLTLDDVEVNGAGDAAIFAFPATGVKVARALLPKAGPPPARKAEGAPPAAAGSPVVDSGVISGIGARNIGSAAMSGRIAAVAASVSEGKTTLYVGAASGGVWKSLDGGTTFKPVFDKNPVQSIGAITLDPSNPQTVWVGSGEAWTRNSVSAGNGIYKSTDGGATWSHMGLPESERIVRILVHPKNGNVVYACVPGKLWSDSPDRGVYKTTDGGKSWALVLKGGNLSTGCSGLSFDPTNPEVLFSGMWDFRRKGWTYRSGGETPDAPSASGMYRTVDGGATWTQLTPSANKGLPAGPWGRVEVEVAPSDPKMVYALIESKDSALYASTDGGVTWEQRDKSQNVVWRPFYFARLVVDPVNSQRLFKPDLSLVVSEDGGKSFAYSGGGSHGDWHDLFIDPTNPRHIIGGDDGGLWISYDGGSRWWKSGNLPVSQFYHVSLDARDPYQVYGGLQDNSSWVGDSQYPGGITNSRWENLYGGDGFWTLVDPTDPEAVYAEYQGGHIGRIDRRTHANRNIMPTPGYKEKLRFNWNTPIALSPTQKGTLYIGAQFLFRSRDRGDTWQRISPDLSTNDPEKQKQEESGGVTVDNSSAEMHTTIYSISESPRNASVIWVGTDDGNVQLTRDAGKTWTNVVGNVTGLPAHSWVSWVEASRFDAATAYATFDRHTFGDLTPWVYKTTDYGKTWTRIVGPDKGVRGYAHTVKEDVVQPQLLFVGTEYGLWISVDGGGKWAEFKGGDFPSVAVREIQVHPREHDLVLATHGRGIWIVDDITPLRSLSAETLAKSAAFLPARPVQQRMPANGGWAEGDAGFSGQNPPGGAAITYYQRARHLFGKLQLDVLDPAGKVVDSVTTTNRRGINRVVWSMQVKAPRVPKAAQLAGNATQGPRVVPGTYTARLVKGGQTLDQKLVIGLDRRAPYTAADRKLEFDATMKAHALFGDMSALVDRIEAIHGAAEQRAAGLPPTDALAGKLGAVGKALEEAKKKIVATKEGGAITGEERIREHLDDVYGALAGWEGRPTQYQVDRVAALRRELDDVTKEVETIVARDVRPLDAELRSRNLQPLPVNAGPQAALDAPSPQEAQCLQTRGLRCPESPSVAAETR